MNKRSYGEPCKNEAGHKDNSLCQTQYCNEDGLCNWRSGEKDCRSKDTGKINMVDKGGGYSGSSLGECEGDCDSDANCAGDLECWHRSPNYPAIPPGCSGYPHAVSHDYCYDPSKLTFLGWYGQPSQNCACLQECEADCDSDNDCFGGLKCYQRGHGGSIPSGCKWPGNWDTDNILDADFCYDPTKWPGNRLPNKGDAEPAPIEFVFEVSSWRSFQVMCGLVAFVFAVCCVFAWYPCRRAKYATVRYDSEYEDNEAKL